MSERLTIDDAIMHEKKVAEEKYLQGMLCHANPNDIELDKCIECGKGHEQLAKWLEELKQYRKLKEQGLLLRLPVAVGDMVYYPEEDYNFVYPVRISSIIITNLGKGQQCRQYNGCSFNCNGDPEQEFEFDDEDFGENVFLTQSEAEEKLRELEEK